VLVLQSGVDPSGTKTDVPVGNSERVAIGVSGAAVLLMPSVIPAVRLSMPLSGRVGVDIDVGTSVFWGDDGLGQVPEGLAVSAQMRWLSRPRDARGRGRYWLTSGFMARGRSLSADGVISDRRAIENVQLGYGWDRVSNGIRSGFEVAVGVAGRDGEGVVRFFLLWGKT